MTDIYEDNTDVFEDVAPAKVSRTPWNMDASYAYAERLATASMNYDKEALDQIHNELVSYGESPTAKSVEASVKEVKVQTAMDISSSLVPELGAEQTANILMNRVNEINSGNVNHMLQEELVMNSLASSPTDWSEEQFHSIMNEENIIYADTMQRRAEHEFFSGGIIKGIADFVGSFAPFNEARSWVKLQDKLEEKYGVDFGHTSGTYFMQGEYSTAVRDWYEGLDSAERLDVLKTLNDVLPEVSGYFGNNDFIANSMLSTIVEKAEGGELDLGAKNNTTEVLDNLGSILELVGVAQMIRTAKTIYKTSKGIKDAASTASVMERTNKEAAATQQAAAVMGDSTQAAKMGTTNDEIIADSLLPKWSSYENSPHVSKELFEQQMDSIKRAVGNEADLSLHLTDAEKTLQTTNLQKELSKARNGKLWENASSINRTDTGMEITARYGKNNLAGFDTPEAAHEMVREFKAKFPEADVTVVRKDYDGVVLPENKTRMDKAIDDLKDSFRIHADSTKKRVGELVEKSKKTALTSGEKNFIRKHADSQYNADLLEKGGDVSKLKGDGATAFASIKRSIGRSSSVTDKPILSEYFVDVKHVDNYKIENAKRDTILNLNDIIYTGDAAKYMADISSGLAKHLSDSFYRAHDKTKKLERDILTILRPFLEASNANKKRIMSIVDEGSDYRNADGSIGKNFTAEEVLEKIPDTASGKDMQEIVTGYMAIRMMADTSHAILNRSLRQSLVAEGYKHVSFGDFHYLGKPVEGDDLQKLPKKIFDVEKNEFIVPPDDLTGFSVYQSKEMIGKGNSYGRYFITTSKAEVNALPIEVMKYRPGYVPRMYKENYFITVVPKRAYIDGVLVGETEAPLKTIAVASSKKAAEKQVKALTEKYPDMTVDWKHDRGLTDNDIIEQEISLRLNTGGMFYSKRGDHLATEGGKLAETENAVAAISRMASGVARRTELTPIIDLHKQRWISKFGGYSEGGFPKSKDMIKNPNKITDSNVDKARAYWDYIDMQVNSGSVSPWWRAKMVKFSEVLEDKTGSEKLGSFFRTTVADHDPIGLVRGATFTSMIVLNPIRQLFINSQQQLFLASLDSKYVMSGSALRDSWKMSRIAIKAHPEDREKALASLSGMDRDMAEGFLESGLIEAVDSHLIGRDALFAIDREITSSKIGAAYQKVANVGRGTLGAARTYGFDFGEILNIGSTYGIAYRRWIKNNPGKAANTAKARYEIAADARQMSFGMTQAGSMGYQRGFMSLPTQFMPVQHKAFMAMIGQNQTFTKTEAKRIAISQAMLFGASGIGLAGAIDWAMDKAGIEAHPVVRNALVGGMYDMTLNGIINGITGADTNLMAGKNIAAGSGWAETFVDKLSDFHNTSAMEFLLGPSATTFSRFGNAFSLTGSIIGARVFSDDDFSEAQDAKDALNAWASIASVYANFKKGYAMHEQGGVVDKALMATGIPASAKDAAMRGLFGIGTYEEDAYYDHVTKASEKKKWMQGIADIYYTRAAERYARWGKEGSYPSIDMMIKANNHERQVLEALYGKRDATQIMGLVEDLIKTRTEKNGTTLINQVATAAMQGTYGSSYEEIITNLKNAGYINDDQKAQFDTLEGYMFNK